MALTNDQITAQNFADFYQTILPYLNGGGVGLKLLWENPNPTQAMASGAEINLSSDDYDLLILIAKQHKDTSDALPAVIAPKGFSFRITQTNASSSGASAFFRLVSYTTDIKYTVGDCSSSTGTSASAVSNNQLIPYRIYGIKVYNRDVQSDYEIIDGTIDSIGANAKKTITLSPTIPTGKKVIGWSMYAVDSDLQTYMQYYGDNYILCVKNIGNNAMSNKDYRVVFIYGQ